MRPSLILPLIASAFAGGYTQDSQPGLKLHMNEWPTNIRTLNGAISRVDQLNFTKSASKRRKIQRKFRATSGKASRNTRYKASPQYRRNGRVSFVGAKQLAKLAKTIDVTPHEEIPQPI